MTEQEWAEQSDPKPMLWFVIQPSHPRVQDIESFPDCLASDRKLRLFACACYYHMRAVLPHPLAQEAVEVAERFAEGQATSSELMEATTPLWEATRALQDHWYPSQGAERIQLAPIYEALALALQVVRKQAPKAAYYASSNAYLFFNWMEDARELQIAEKQYQADILRCNLGPLEHVVSEIQMDDVWLTPTVRGVALNLYQERRFEDMPILGDALEDADCDNEEILRHCNEGGVHARGCWVLDSILGKD